MHILNTIIIFHYVINFVWSYNLVCVSEHPPACVCVCVCGHVTPIVSCFTHNIHTHSMQFPACMCSPHRSTARVRTCVSWWATVDRSTALLLAPTTPFYSRPPKTAQVCTYSTVSRLNTQSCANNIVLSPDCLTLLRQMSYKFLFSFVVFVFQFGCGACRRLLLWCVSRATTTLSGVCSLGRSLCSIEYILSLFLSFFLSLTDMHTIHVHVHNINFIISL